MAVQGNLAYVADYREGLQVIDVTDPAAPVRVGGLDSSRRAADGESTNHCFARSDG